jgi:hypothetical protein
VPEHAPKRLPSRRWAITRVNDAINPFEGKDDEYEDDWDPPLEIRPVQYNLSGLS